MQGGLVSSFWSCGGLWVRYCVYVWECYLETSQRECLTRQFLTLSFQLWAFIVCSGALVGTYLAYGQGTLDLLSSLNIGLNSSLYPLACGGGWGWVWYEEGRGLKGKGRGWAFSLSLLSFGILFYFFRSWFLFSSKYTAILASSPGGRGRKNLLPSGPLWK